MESARLGNKGYAMAALLVGLSVMAVLMSALLPVWSHMARREKEEELIFRGKQYARAIGLFQRKYANTAPPSIDVLLEQRFLRKKYKDPITNDEFQPIYANQAAIQPPGGGPSATRPGQQPGDPVSAPPAPAVQSGFGGTGGGVQGGVIGVTSKSKDTSIKLYNGRSKYNEWAFVYIQTAARPGLPGGPGQPAGPGQPGGPGQQGQPFGMPGGAPGQGPGVGQPNRPPIVPPNSPFQTPRGANPNGQPNGSTIFTPASPARRPGSP